MKRKRRHIMITEGDLAPNMFWYAIPIMLSGMMQLMFNIMNTIVVGRFSGSVSLAAVGSNGALINLLLNLALGLSLGTNVVMARYYGSRQYDKAKTFVSTALITALSAGLFIALIGIVSAASLLELMNTPKDVLPQAALYIRIYFIGTPANMIYNFGAALFYGSGDTKRPFYFLSVAGLIHISLNMLLVIGFGLGVIGVALATIAAHYTAGGLILYSMIKSDNILRLNLKNLEFDKESFFQMAKIGLPAGMESIIFNISNIFIQSAINTFGSVAMAGNAAASNLESFIYTAMNAFNKTNLTFISQNIASNRFDRIRQIIKTSLVYVISAGLLLGVSAYIFGDILLGIFTNDADVIYYGLIRVSIIVVPYVIYGIMETFSESIRGLGYLKTPMMISFVGIVLLRIFWITVVFERFRTLQVLYLSYPVTWLITSIALGITFFFIYRKVKLKYQTELV